MDDDAVPENPPSGFARTVRAPDGTRYLVQAGPAYGVSGSPLLSTTAVTLVRGILRVVNRILAKVWRSKPFQGASVNVHRLDGDEEIPVYWWLGDDIEEACARAEVLAADVEAGSFTSNT